MSNSDIILESEEEPTLKKPIRRKKRWRYILYSVIVLAILFISFTVKASFTNDESVWANLLEVSGKYISPHFSIGSSLAALTATPEKTLIGSEDDRINILLLGIGGRGHDGGNLTDTIIIASYKPSTNQATMMSIPRDLQVPIPGYGWRKINSVYALREYNEPGTGGEYAKELISQIFGVDIPYYTRIDFKGFEEVIDLVGGIEVQVPNTLSDYQYPIAGRENFPENQRYEHLYIEEGQQEFDGSTALKYVRSRHAAGEEGSDFARAARQQLVIDAFMDKILSFSTLLQPGRITRIVQNVEQNVDTNLSIEEMVAFAKLARDYKNDENRPEIINVVLDNDIDGPLRAANYNGAFVLEPKVEDYSELKFMAQNIFYPDLTYERPSAPSGVPVVTLDNPVESTEEATIEIQNGTFVKGLAGANKDRLEALGYNVIEIGNSENQDYSQTVIYDLSNGQFPSTIEFLGENYTETVTTSIPLGVSSDADILVILGLDAAY